MKNKPIAHKSANRFAFKSFNEQLADISIHFGKHQLKNRHLYEDGEQTKFVETLNKWDDLNCTQDFLDLKCKLGSRLTLTTLAQIVHRKDELIEILKGCLKNSENKALEVALELVVALAFDLQNEFYPYFIDLFDILVNLLQNQDTKLLEAVFMCFAYLFKNLWRYILNDFRKIFSRFAHKLLTRNQKDYIKAFAAQSFSFLMRKIENKEAFFELIFEQLEKRDDLCHGYGILLFEAVKGVKQQLHSGASSLMSAMLKKFLEPRWLISENIFSTLNHYFELLTLHVTKTTSEVIWFSLFDLMMKVNNPLALNKLGELLKVLIVYKDCSLVIDAEKVLNVISKVVGNVRNDENCMNTFLISASVIISKLHSTTSLKSISCFVKSIFSHETRFQNAQFFVLSLKSYVFLERDILPYFLPFFINYIKGKSENVLVASLKVFVDLLLYKYPKPLLGSNLTAKVLTLNFPTIDSEENLSNRLLNLVQTDDSLISQWSSLVCLPHIKPIDKLECSRVLSSLVKRVLEKLSAEMNEQDDQLLQLICLEAVYASFLLDNRLIFEESIYEAISRLISLRPSSVCLLHVFDYYLEFAKRVDKAEILELNRFESIYPTLEINLCSPSKSVRLLTLHIASLFNPPLPPTDSAEFTHESIFSLCLNAEVLPVSVQDFREKLRILQKLEYGVVNSSIPIEAVTGFSYEQTPIYFLLGILYTNFSLLWPSVNNIIETHARGCKNIDTFWKILMQNYHKTLNFINGTEILMNKITLKDENAEIISTQPYEQIYQLSEDRADHYIHRIQLLKLMQLIADVIEKKNRDFVQLFFDFLEQEASSITIHSGVNRENLLLDENSENTFEEGFNIEENSENSNGKMVWKTLFSFLEVFSKFRNPKALYREPELRDLFNNLLQSRDSALQKTTLDCILAYEFPFIMPYKENLLRLIDNKTFKSEIVHFNLNPTNEEDMIIKMDHRKELMPYIMRIIYGKMLYKTGDHTSGQSKSSLRRSVVFRFLAGCPEDELFVFFKLAFSSFTHLISQDFAVIFESHKKMNLKECIPIRKALSSIKTLDLMLTYIGNIAKKLLPDFFKLLVIISSFATSLLHHRSEMKEIYITKLKVLRGECLKMGAKFFHMFDDYNYSKSEIDAFFTSLVFPLLPNLSNESLSSPSPLLKLIVSWSENPRYFVLLMKHLDSTPNIYPLAIVMDLYEDSKCHTSVVDLISQMLVNLVELATFNPMEIESEEPVYPLEVSNVVDIEPMIKEENQINYGTAILLPFIPKIISRMKSNFGYRSQTKGKRTRMTSDELTILTHIAPFVKDETQCRLLSKLFMGTFNEKQRRSEEADCQLIQTISCLVKQTSSIEDEFFSLFIPLFRFIKERLSRVELCNLLNVISGIDPKFIEINESITMLNSYNPRNPEEPDYCKRMDGFKLVKEFIENMNSQTDHRFIALIVYNCCAFISFIDDLGIREASSDVIQTIIKKIIELNDKSLFTKICLEIIFAKEIQRGIKEKNENARHEFIAILRVLVKNGHDQHLFLKQLYVLCNDDDELDFFITIRHIQLHRRSRALTRLTKNVEVFASLSSSVLSSFILPIATSFLFDKSYSKNSGLITSAIETIGTICRYIEWPVYKNLLKLYLELLVKDYENHKTIVRLLSTILNNFNFDLSNADESSPQLSAETMEASTKQKLSSTQAKKIQEYIINNLLPKLREHLHSFSRADYEYDSMKSEYPEDSEIQRVPLAFAIVSLLKVLPSKENLLEANISSVFLRLLNFLKSKSENIRETARSSLIKVMQCLGPKYFPYLLREMRAMLRKGYQIHILTYTLNSLVTSLSPQLSSGDFDPCLEDIIEICVEEIFSNIAEEKEVGKIVAKVKEARKSKSFDTFFIIASFASEQSLSQVILPLKKILSETHSHKVLKKVEKCLQKVIIGLTENSALSETTLLTFFYGIVHDSIPDLQLTKKSKKKTYANQVTNDCFLLQQPKKKDSKAKTNASSNYYILVQESLKILSILLKKERLQATDEQHAALLNPFIPILSDFVSSKHPKLTISALKCINSIVLKFSSLESFKIYANTIKNNLFVLLHKHTGVGMQHGENYELVMMCFKCMHYLISEVDCIEIDEKQLKVLLLYAEKDIHENNKQAVAFSLLKAIISKRLDSPELKAIMAKLSEMLVQSEQDYVRKQCVHIWMRYLLDYPHGKSLKQHIMFFLRQLDYEHETGRMAVLELLALVVSRFPEVVVNSYVELLFIPVSSRLINEESSKARKLSADLIEKLFSRLNADKRNFLFENLILPWFQQRNLLQQQLGARLCLLLAEVEQKSFNSRVSRCIPLIQHKLNLQASSENSDGNTDFQTQKDHLIYHLLLLFLRIIKINPSIVKSSQFSEDTTSIFKSIASIYILYPHVWVRVTSVEIFNFLFSLYNIDEIVAAVKDPEDADEFILQNTASVIWNLCTKFLDLLHEVYDSENLGEQLIKNLVFIGKVFCRLPDDWNSDEDVSRKLNIKWLINRLSRETRTELSENAKCYTKRSLIFKWIAAIVLELDKERLVSYLELLLPSLCRETAEKTGQTNEDNAKEEVHNLAHDVLRLIQTAVGNETFNSVYAKVISSLSRKRLQRKNQRAIEVSKSLVIAEIAINRIVYDCSLL
ncbi:hypothetical protein B4U79_02561 [Dinothrombium tinctorium]|uniref:Uncharacterized protein n=1 Tax=Dinothrombium tinctorium TaxID=1965070 RepID=A0A443R2Z6_9ACAR|nr:hypothetical protein B4U79_02561 [Dinothrombium tinctorium]